MPSKLPLQRGGRLPGQKNLIGKSAKENVIAVFTRLGGTAQMADWAKKNQTDFYRLYAKLIPQQIEGELNIPVALAVKVTFETPKSTEGQST